LSRTILRRRRVEEKTGLGHTQIYEGIKEGSFPRPIPLGRRIVGWLESEIDGWIENRIAERDRKPPRAA
jgi:prophage regulatory protein